MAGTCGGLPLDEDSLFASTWSVRDSSDAWTMDLHDVSNCDSKRQGHASDCTFPWAAVLCQGPHGVVLCVFQSQRVNSETNGG